MTSYRVGQVIENFKNHHEGVLFDIADDGATLIIFFGNPTQDEINQFKSGNKFEIRFLELYGLIIITAKIGNLNWMDAPYLSHLSKNLSELSSVGKNQGLGLTIMLVDAVTGEIKHMRLVGLSERFTKQLFKVVSEQKLKDFNVIEYREALNKIYSSYSTNQIVKMSRDYCKIQ